MVDEICMFGNVQDFELRRFGEISFFFFSSFFFSDAMNFKIVKEVNICQGDFLRSSSVKLTFTAGNIL